jgi:hypothetical protein
MTDWSVIVNEEGHAIVATGTQACFMVTGGELALALLEGRLRARRGLGRMVIGLPIGAALADREYAASFCATQPMQKAKRAQPSPERAQSQPIAKSPRPTSIRRQVNSQCV